MGKFKERVQEIFAEYENQSEALVEIYKLVFADEFIKIDKKYHPKVFPGGLWLNTGFSSNSRLDDWEICFDNCSVEY